MVIWLHKFYRPAHRLAFTLIELMAVVLVIAMLVSIFLGVTVVVKRKAMEGLSKTQLHQLMLALESYRDDQGTYPITPCDSPRIMWRGAPYPSPLGLRPFNYQSSMTATGMGPYGAGQYLGGVTIPCIVSNNAALRRAIDGKYCKATASQKAKITSLDNDTGSTLTNDVYVDPYMTPWGYFNTTNPNWKIRQFNAITYDLWSYGAMAFTYSSSCYPCGPTGSVTITSASANPKNSMLANWRMQ